MTVETCTQYLVSAAESVSEGATRIKSAPPLQPQGSQALLVALMN